MVKRKISREKTGQDNHQTARRANQFVGRTLCVMPSTLVPGRRASVEAGNERDVPLDAPLTPALSCSCQVCGAKVCLDRRSGWTKPEVLHDDLGGDAVSAVGLSQRAPAWFVKGWA